MVTQFCKEVYLSEISEEFFGKAYHSLNIKRIEVSLYVTNNRLHILFSSNSLFLGVPISLIMQHCLPIVVYYYEKK